MEEKKEKSTGPGYPDPSWNCGCNEIKPGPGEVSIVLQAFTENKRFAAMLEFKEGDKIGLDYDRAMHQCRLLAHSTVRTLFKNGFLKSDQVKVEDLA